MVTKVVCQTKLVKTKFPKVRQYEPDTKTLERVWKNQIIVLILQQQLRVV